jgi:hypothetical protein
MNRNLISAVLLAASALAAAPSFAHGEADYAAQFPATVSQRSRAEVKSDAIVAAQHAADVDAKSKVAPQVKSSLTRDEVRQAAAEALRAGQIPHGEFGAY